MQQCATASVADEQNVVWCESSESKVRMCTCTYTYVRYTYGVFANLPISIDPHLSVAATPQKLD